MKRKALFTFALLIIFGFILAIFFVLKNDKALLAHPKGLIAHHELSLISTNILLMLIIVLPTLVILYFIAWKYRAKNWEIERTPKEDGKRDLVQIVFWAAPAVIVLIMALITCKATFRLDPYRPIKSEVKPLTIQVVALDWKWLFIYPQQGIATLNFVQFPSQTPIHFAHTADGSPMNSFWIPQLSGQIYTMTGMETPLHIMADGDGEYMGRAAEINGDGYADMTFVAKSTSLSDFESWVESVKQSPHRLNDSIYNELTSPSIGDPITLYSSVENGLFDKIMMKYMPPSL